MKVYFFVKEFSQRKPMLKIIITVSRRIKSSCMPFDDFCFIRSKGSGNLVRDMRCCDCGTSINSSLILPFYYDIQHWLQIIPFCLLHNWFCCPFLTSLGENHLSCSEVFLFFSPFETVAWFLLVFALWSSAASYDRATTPLKQTC